MTHALIPFVPTLQLTMQQHQVLALAAVFQAAQLVHLVATSGTAGLSKEHQNAVTILIHAALNIRAGENVNSNSLVMFNCVSHLQLGLATLERCLAKPYSPLTETKRPKFRITHPKLALTYSIGLFSLSAKVYRKPNYQEQIIKTQQQIIRQLTFFDYSYQHTSILASLAQVYSNTASQLKPKIMVKGTANTLQNPQEITLIRALLFTGLQAAHYWRQLGGNPWKLIFAKSKIIKDIRFFAELQHQQHSRVESPFS